MQFRRLIDRTSHRPLIRSASGVAGAMMKVRIPAAILFVALVFPSIWLHTKNSYYYGSGVKCNKTEAVKWYRMAAERGFVPAQSKLGDCLFYGYGTEQNEQEGLKWWRMAAAQGYGDAIESLRQFSK